MDATETLGLLPLYIEPNTYNVRRFFSIFNCQNCGQCCSTAITKRDGIHLTPQEVKLLATVINISPRKFKDNYTFACDSQRYLKYPCPFWDKKCKIYYSRPSVCRLYPINTPIKENGKEYLAINLNCPEGKRIGEKLLNYARR